MVAISSSSKQIDKVSTTGVGIRGGSVSNRPAPLVGGPDHRGVERSVAECLYTFTGPVTENSEGKFTVDIGTAKVPFSMDDLRNGVNIGLS